MTSTNRNSNNAIPPTLDHIVGNQNVIFKLKVAVEASFIDGKALPHTMLTGPPGVGIVYAQVMGDWSFCSKVSSVGLCLHILNSLKASVSLSG